MTDFPSSPDTASEKAVRDYEHGYNDGVEWAMTHGHAPTPAGWKLVPVRPTHRQMDAGLYQSSADSTYQDVYSTYADMIDAAPSVDDPPSDTAQVRADASTITSTSREGKDHV